MQSNQFPPDRPQPPIRELLPPSQSQPPVYPLYRWATLLAVGILVLELLVCLLGTWLGW